MCGISGFVPLQMSAERGGEVIARMNARLAHRGPDNQGLYVGGNTCLGHTRLSIIDLSPQSNQPFSSPDGRFVIVYNGELYNYRELKLELQRAPHGSAAQPYFFHTQSDTEVVLAAFSRWGVECLHRFRGMFAFALYDTVEEKLWIARDPIGVKPLYYWYGAEGFIFASELRAIIHSGIRSFTLDRDTLPEYLMYQTVHAPATIVAGVKMLMPGHYLEYHRDKAQITRYYDLNKIEPAPEQTYNAICTQVFSRLSRSVEMRLRADVPFGAFLSGGIDSSAIVALMSQVSSEKVNTFNVSFDESEFSESRYARLISGKFGTRHHEIKLSPSDFLAQLPESLAALDHPSGDGPNTYVVSKATRQAGITMALSGIGGDELFAGYEIFRRMRALEKKSWINAVPRFVRLGAAAFAGRKNTIAAKKTAELLREKELSFTSAYMLSRTVYSASMLENLSGSGVPRRKMEALLSGIPQTEGYLLSAVSLAEIQTYLQNVLLRDTDQMSMAVALEVREPFLDIDLVRYVLGVSDRHKFPSTPKKLLTDSLGDLLPREIIDRPKMGFTLPWKQWLKGELRSFCEEQIRQLDQKQILLPGAAGRMWQRFLADDPLVPWSRVWHLVVLSHWMSQNKLHP